MAGRDDFGSGMKSPGGWGGSGGGMGGGMGNSKSSSNYNYRSGAGQRGPAIGNWNTGGAVVGMGNQFGVQGMGENNLGRGPWPGGYAQPVLKKQLPSLLGVPQPNAYPPVTQEDIPAPPPAQPPAPGAMSWPPGSMGHGSTWGGRPVQPAAAPQGSYTRPPGAAFGYSGSGYMGMGNDFRSNNFSQSFYPGGDGITSNDIGGGGWRR